MGQRATAKHIAQFLPLGQRQRPQGYRSPGHQHLLEELPALVQPCGPDTGAQIGHVNGQGHIFLNKLAVRLLGQVGEFLEAGPIQDKIRQLGISCGAQSLPSPGNAPAEDLCVAPQILPAVVLGQAGGGVASAPHQQRLLVHPQGLPLHQHLGVVVVVGAAEHVQQRPVAHGGAQIVEQVGLGLGEHLLDPLGRHLSHILISALGEHLGSLGQLPGLDHPLHTLGVQKPGLHGVDAGGYGQIVQVFFP